MRLAALRALAPSAFAGRARARPAGDDAPSAPGGALLRLRLHGWLDPVVVALAFTSMAVGFGQFGAVAALGDVARSFGRVTHGATIAEQAGLSGTELGIGLAILRLASVASLPLTGIADRFGRRRMLFASCALGLCLTVAAAASPGYWWFVAIFALGRPLLSTASALAQVTAAEQTDTRNRARAIALIAAGYGVGSGLTAVINSLASSSLGFRGLFALAAVPLVLLPLAARQVSEPDRFVVAATAAERPMPVIGALGPEFRRRLVVVAAISFTIAVMTGPANSFVYLYSENVLRVPGLVVALMVVAAGVTGFGGLVLGQWLADRAGRRPTGALTMIAMALLAMLTYSGSRPALVVGYVLGVMAASAFAPAAGALANELFPTSVRASVAGWEVVASVLGAVVGLLAFGAIADVGNRFSIAAVVVFAVAIPAAALFWFLPETRGLEPEELWPDPGPGAPAGDESPKVASS